MKKEDVIAFYNINGLEKFCPCMESPSKVKVNGKDPSSWFYGVRNQILESNDKICLEIAKQYQQYLVERDKDRRNVDNISKAFKKKLTDFSEIEDLNKFDMKSNIHLKSGKFAAYFFYKNEDYILHQNTDVCITIRKQYQQYLAQLKTKNILKYLKLKREFISEESLEKFDIDSDLTFKSDPDIKMSEWFFANKVRIEKSENKPDIAIIIQYKSFLRSVRAKNKIKK